jgi:hypothetical protein
LPAACRETGWTDIAMGLFRLPSAQAILRNRYLAVNKNLDLDFSE